MDITKLSPRSGRVVAENGQTRNIVDMLGGGTPVSSAQYDITQFSPRSGRLIGEDGKAYNLVNLIGSLNETIEELQKTATEIDVNGKLSLTGGALTGDVTTPVTQFTSTSLVTRQFVEDAIANITDYESEVFPNG